MELKWKWNDKRGTAQFGGTGDWAHVLHCPPCRGRKVGFYQWIVYVNHYRTGEGKEPTSDEAKRAAEAWEAENGTEYRRRYGGYASPEAANAAKRAFLIGNIEKAKGRVRDAESELAAADAALADFEQSVE